MTLTADFIKDVAARCTDMLTAAGYVYQPSDDRDAIRTYVSIRRRRVSSCARTVHKAPYIVPTHLVVGEQQLLAKVAAGGDLWPHQSRKIGNVAAEDGMLNDFGIQHFHLGTTPDPHRPHLIEGTSELLFAVVKDDGFYSLGIFDHTAWSKEVLLNIIQSNWPQLIAPYTLTGSGHTNVIGLAQTYMENDAAALRKNNINVIRQRPDGTIHMGMGGGITTDGKSLVATRETLQLEKFAKSIEEEVRRKVLDKISTGVVPSDAQVRLEWRGHVPFAVTIPAGFEEDLSAKLEIGSL